MKPYAMGNKCRMSRRAMKINGYHTHFLNIRGVHLILREFRCVLFIVFSDAVYQKVPEPVVILFRVCLP